MLLIIFTTIGLVFSTSVLGEILMRKMGEERGTGGGEIG